MRTRIPVYIYTLCFFLTVPCAAAAQPAGDEEHVTVQELRLRDGSRLFGWVEAEDDRELTFRMQSGTTVTVSRDDVIAVRSVRGRIANGEFQPADPNATRLFFGPTGRSLLRGQVYVGVYSVLLPFVQAGITDRFSLGAGTPLFFGLGESERPFWVTPKLQVFNRSSTKVSVGAIHVLDLDGEHHAGVGYVVATRGGLENSVTAGLGVAYDRGSGGRPVAMIGGDRRVRRNLKILTESYVWSGGGIVSGGVRVLGEKLSADLGLAVPLGAGGIFAFPVVNLVYVF